MNNSLIWCALLMLLMQLASCGDRCRSGCENNSYCHEGECICTKWYSGEQCQLLYNRNYEGEFLGEKREAERSEQNRIYISADEEIPNRIYIESGLYLEFETDTSLVIPVQIFRIDSDTHVVTGSGNYSLNHIEFMLGPVNNDTEQAYDFTKPTYYFNGHRVTELQRP